MAETGYKITAYWVKPVLATKYAIVNKFSPDIIQSNAILCPVSTVFARKSFLSEVGFEPTPTDVDQNALVRLLLSLAP